MGTLGAGLFRVTGGRTTRFGPGRGLGSPPVTSLAATPGPDGRGFVRVGTRLGGLARVQDAPWAAFDRDTGLPGEQVLGLLEAPGTRGRPAFCFGTGDGVTGLEEGRVSPPRRSGLSCRSSARPAFRSDDAGVLLAVEGEAGRPEVWAGGERSGLGHFAAGRWKSLGQAEGLPGAACNKGSLVGGAGRVWVATAAGATVLDPRRAERGPRRHPLVVERVTVAGAPRPVAGPLRIGPAERTVAIACSLLACHGESLIRYRTRLEGREKEPTEWTASTRREFTNLPPGRSRPSSTCGRGSSPTPAKRPRRPPRAGAASSPT